LPLGDGPLFISERSDGFLPMTRALLIFPFRCSGNRVNCAHPFPPSSPETPLSSQNGVRLALPGQGELSSLVDDVWKIGMHTFSGTGRDRITRKRTFSLLYSIKRTSLSSPSLAAGEELTSVLKKRHQ